MVPGGGLEPPWVFTHTALNRARLPVPPSRRVRLPARAAPRPEVPPRVAKAADSLLLRRIGKRVFISIPPACCKGFFPVSSPGKGLVPAGTGPAKSRKKKDAGSLPGRRMAAGVPVGGAGGNSENRSMTGDLRGLGRIRSSLRDLGGVGVGNPPLRWWAEVMASLPGRLRQGNLGRDAQATGILDETSEPPERARRETA